MTSNSMGASMPQNAEVAAVPTNSEKAAFLDAAIQNPDTQLYGSPVDDCQGNSIVRKQKITTNIVVPPSTTGAYPAATVDIYFVDWDFEIPSDCVLTGYTPGNGAATSLPGMLLATYLQRDFNDAGTGPNTGAPHQSEGMYIIGPSPTVSYPGATGVLPVGGLVAYIMLPGQSPFPVNDGTTIGPCQPWQVVPLPYGTDVLSDQWRLIGENFEINYTAPEITAQGVWTQSGQPSNVSLATEVFPLTTPAGWGSSNILEFTAPAVSQLLLPGGPSTLIKAPGAVQRPAYDGVLQNSRVDWSLNRPALASTTCRRYYAQSSIASNANQFWDLFVNLGTLAVTTTAHAPFYGLTGNFGANAGQQGPMYVKNTGLHVAVATGLIPAVTMQLSRTITSEAFLAPTSQFITFSKASPPADKKVMEEVENTLNRTPQFWAAADNAGGRFSKFAKKVFKTTKGVVNFVAPESKVAGLLNTTGQLANQASDILQGEKRGRTKPASKQTNANSSQAKEKGKSKAKAQATSHRKPSMDDLKMVLLNMGWSEGVVEKAAQKGRKYLERVIDMDSQ